MVAENRRQKEERRMEKAEEKDWRA